MKFKNKILIIVLIIAIITIVLVAGFFIDYAVKSNRSTDNIGYEETKYKTDETFSKIKNIPYDDFIKDCEVTGKSVIPKISDSATGEKNSSAINQCIEELSISGGGTVYIPKGKYKISSIFLKSNITLFVSKDACLISLTCSENETTDSPIFDALITAADSENIIITGGGRICGNGLTYTNEAENETPFYALKEFNLYTRVIEARKRIRFGKETSRCPLIKLNSCTNSKIENIILDESAGWTCVINNCNDINIENMVIDNHMHVANTDGIDITGSSKVKINNCFIATGDDGIVLKPIDNKISDITVSNCVISSCANCFKIGTETQFDVDNVNVSNCEFFMPDGMTYGYSGIAIESADGSNISNVNIDNITMDGISSPLLIWLGNRMNYDNTSAGSISDIKISNINAVNTELPSAITGFKSDGEVHYIENISIENFNVSYRDTEENLSVLKPVQEFSMNDYPEITRVSHYYFIEHKYSGYWDLPCYGIFVRHTKNIDYSGYNCTPRQCNNLPFLYTKDNN